MKVGGDAGPLEVIPTQSEDDRWTKQSERQYSGGGFCSEQVEDSGKRMEKSSEK